MPKIKTKKNGTPTSSIPTPTSLSGGTHASTPTESITSSKLSEKANHVIQSADALNKQRDALKIELADIITACKQAIDEFFSAHDCIVTPVLNLVTTSKITYANLVAIIEKTKLQSIHDKCNDSLLCLQQIRIKAGSLALALQTRDKDGDLSLNITSLSGDEGTSEISKGVNSTKIANAKYDFYSLLSYAKSEELFNAMTSHNESGQTMSTAPYSRLFPAPPQRLTHTLHKETLSQESDEYDTVTVETLTSLAASR